MNTGRPAASGAYIIVDNPTDPGTFRFAPLLPPEQIPAAQKKVIAAATDHYANILEYIESEEEQNDWLHNLKQLVSLGTVQPTVDPTGALDQIKSRDKLLKEKLAPYLYPARKRLVLAAAIVGIVALALGLAMRFWPSAIGPKFDLGPISNYAFAVAAAMPALIIQYLVAIKTVTLKTYAELRSDLASPALDAFACAIMCVIVVALFASGAVAVNIKGLETKDVETNVRTAIVLGILCGLASRRLGPSLLGIGAKFTSRFK